MDDRRSTRRILGLALLIVAATLLISACASRDDALGSIPAAPNEARELSAEEMPFDLEAVAEGFRTSIDAGNVDIRVYSFPTGTTFAQIVAHYEKLLSGAWHEQQSQALDDARAQGRDAMIWTNDDTSEILSVQYMSATSLDGNLLVVIYAQRD